jgi:hypothetical protein
MDEGKAAEDLFPRDAMTYRFIPPPVYPPRPIGRVISGDAATGEIKMHGAAVGRIAGAEVRGGDLVYQGPDGKIYPSDKISFTSTPQRKPDVLEPYLLEHPPQNHLDYSRVEAFVAIAVWIALMAALHLFL